MDSSNAEKKTKKIQKTQEVVSSSEEESDVELSESEGSLDGSTSGSESEAEVIVEKKKNTSLKRKRATKIEEDNDKKAKKRVKSEKTKKNKKEEKKGEKKDEKKDDITEGEKIFDEEVGEKKKKVSASFDAGRVDMNLHTEDPNNIITRTVQISTGLKMACRMVSGTTAGANKVTYPDWAALIFIKKIKDDKSFEFNVSLKDAPRIIEGLNYIINENKTFFNK